MRALSLVLLLLLLAGCAGNEETVSTAPGTSLEISYTAEEGAAPGRWTLTCDPAGGTHPDAASACRDLAAAGEPFAPIPADAMCTEIYGGPQTATVRGTFRGAPVDLELSRVNGCFVAQWERLGALLPPLS